MQRSPLFPLLLLAAFIVRPLSAQGAGSLEGTWERVAVSDSAGRAQGPMPAVLMFTSDGYYIQFAFPPGRPRLPKPLAELTREELVSLYLGVSGRFGRYEVRGDTLRRSYAAAIDTNVEGRPDQVQLMRLEGDLLVLRATANGGGEARFRRLSAAGQP